MTRSHPDDVEQVDFAYFFNFLFHKRSAHNNRLLRVNPLWLNGFIWPSLPKKAVRNKMRPINLRFNLFN